MSELLRGEYRLRAICDKALAAAQQNGGEQVEAVVIARNAALTRFANAAIHQNVVSREAELRVRVQLDDDVATALGCRPGAAKSLIHRAVEQLRKVL